MALDIERRDASLTGLTDTEAKDFHTLFMTSFLIFTGIAVVAHFLVWMWRPWLPGPNGYARTSQLLIDGAHQAAHAAASLVA